jgi:hypothetical protein
MGGRVTVAVKQSRLEVSVQDIKEFFAEVHIMKAFSKPHHKNVWPNEMCISVCMYGHISNACLHISLWRHRIHVWCWLTGRAVARRVHARAAADHAD